MKKPTPYRVRKLCHSGCLLGIALSVVGHSADPGGFLIALTLGSAIYFVLSLINLFSQNDPIEPI